MLSVLHTPGHTPGSQSLLVRSGGDAVLLWGDVANHPAQVDRPETEAMWLAPSHFPEPFGTITRDQDGRHWTGHRRRIMP